MKRTFNTSKFYYAFPIFILGYKDEKFSYNITTCSSSFSLGDMVVVGMFKGSNAFSPIEYIGDEKQRVYRYLDDKNSDKLGTFIRSSKFILGML